jgi:hypothetical protein
MVKQQNVLYYFGRAKQTKVLLQYSHALEVSMHLIALRNVMLRTLVNGYHCGAVICCLQLRGRRVYLGIVYQATWHHILEEIIPIFPTTKILNLKKYKWIQIL